MKDGIVKNNTITYPVQGVCFCLDIQVDLVINYGKSNRYVLLIPGIDGSVNGYKDKYKTIAKRLVQDYDATVVQMSNPHVPSGKWELSVCKVLNYIETQVKKSIDANLYVMGFSLGGYLIGTIAYEYDYITKLLLINPAKMLDTEPLLTGLDKFNGQATILFGGQDITADIIDKMTETGSRVEMVNGADHYFSGEHFNTFCDAPSKYLFKEEYESRERK